MKHKLKPAEPERIADLSTEAGADQVSDPASMELVVLENTSVFKWNFKEIKTRLVNGIQKYSGLVVTEENLPDMEKTQREIASLRTRVNKFRLDTKRLLETPAAKFSSEVNELIQIIAQAEAPLKEQLQKYEDQRVAAREIELNQFAWKTAVAMGVRDQNFQGWQVSSKLTQRGTSDRMAREEIVKFMEDLLHNQQIDDTAKAEAVSQAEEKKRRKDEFLKMVDIMCRNLSAHAGLKTPVVLADIQHLLTPDCGAEMVNEVISQAVRRQKGIEETAAAPAVASIAIPTPPPVMPAPAPTYGPPPTRPEPTKIDVVLRFPEVTVVQAGELRLWLSEHKMTYEVVSQEVAKR